MALPVYISMTGENQGEFDAGGVRKGREKWMEGLSIEHEIIVPTDRLSGMATGNRVHGALHFTKEIDKSSPMIMKALVNAETITEVLIRFFRPSRSGAEEEFYSIKLADAQITGVQTLLPHVHTHGNEKPQEKISLRYGEIEWTYKDGNIVANDKWKEPVGA